MRVKGPWRLPRARRWIKYRLAPRALILMYHRVAELANDPYLLAVTPLHFDEQLEMLRKYASPIGLQQLVKALRQGRVPNRAVVVTFDDGYADNLHQAKPLLEHFEIPATVFVTADQMGSQREFWWDELDRVLLQQGALPARLRLNFQGSTFERELSEASTYTEEDYQRDRSWHIERQDDPSPRQRLFRVLHARLSALPSEERRHIMDDLLAWAGADQTPRASHQALTVDEAARLDTGDLIEVGAHTITHPPLAALSEEEQRKEIEQSKEQLEAILKRRVTSFAFPYGSCAPETVTVLREAGFACACTSHPEAVWRNTDLLQLPRVVVRDWDQETFASWLQWWIDG